VAHYQSWLRNGSRELPRIQAEAATWIGASEAAAGAYAPTFFLALPIVTVIPWPTTGVNAEDLYDRHGVRIVADLPDVEPTWLDDDPATWEDGATLACWPWGTTGACVTRVP
jgi:hypothetical protein